jgi:hypothetical protein
LGTGRVWIGWSFGQKVSLLRMIRVGSWSLFEETRKEREEDVSLRRSRGGREGHFVIARGHDLHSKKKKALLALAGPSCLVCAG